MSLVSVVMPVHDAESTLEASIESVRAQTHTDWRLILVDDASNDSSREVAQAAVGADDRIELVCLPSQSGAAVARNTAIARSSGRYVAFCDADDLWLPSKLERQLEFASATGSPLTFTSYAKIHGGAEVDATAWKGSERVVHARDRVTYRDLRMQNFIGCSTAMYDAEVFGRRPMPLIDRRQDFALWLDLLRDGAVARGLDEVLVLYREGGRSSLSSNKLKAASYNWRIYREIEGWSLPVSALAFASYAVRGALKSRI
ncbi:MAG: glycosyltransferase family 2 protein [Actinomycetota bacterium]|nr:glycosyltransferase family 2 protein [Actinomycetota bacterium]